jgi:glycosyltransferase involved in cell wall biosynthesis
MNRSGEVVILGMFDLTHLGSAMAVRIHNLYVALETLTPTTLLAGSRMARRWAVIHFLLETGLHRIRAIYVEASNGPANESDLLFLSLAKAAGIPILIFIPDAYQYFPDIFPRYGLKAKLLDWGWRRSIATYLRLADLLLFPSPGLAACMDSRQPKEMFPPAGLPNREYIPLSRNPPTIVYVGGGTIRYGSDLLLSAMEQVVKRYPNARCHFITPNADDIARHPARYASWLTVEHLAFDDLPTVMHSATLVVSPLRINPYNDLAVPVKLFDYMSFGRPIVATSCHDTALLLRQLDAGLVVDDTVESLAQGIIHLLENPDLATRLGQNGYQAIQTSHSWPHRAARLLTLIETLEAEKDSNKHALVG